MSYTEHEETNSEPNFYCQVKLNLPVKLNISFTICMKEAFVSLRCAHQKDFFIYNSSK